MRKAKILIQNVLKVGRFGTLGGAIPLLLDLQEIIEKDLKSDDPKSRANPELING